VVPSTKITLPVGTGPPVVIVAVNTTVFPYRVGLSDEIAAVVVLTFDEGLTTSVTTVEETDE